MPVFCKCFSEIGVFVLGRQGKLLVVVVEELNSLVKYLTYNKYLQVSLILWEMSNEYKEESAQKLMPRPYFYLWNSVRERIGYRNAQVLIFRSLSVEQLKKTSGRNLALKLSKLLSFCIVSR